MFKNGIVQGVISNFVWYLLVLGGGATVTFLRRYSSPWASPLLWGVVTAVLISFVILSIKLAAALPKRRKLDDPELEADIRSWLDKFRVGVRNDPSPNAYFKFIATMGNGNLISVGNPRAGHVGYVLLNAGVTPNPHELGKIRQLPAAEELRMISLMRLELARAKVGYQNLVVPFTNVQLDKRIAITDSLTESLFMEKLEEMDAAILLVKNIFSMVLQDNGIEL